ncbi:hypothetical protein L6452_16428 [Arctium lappa]|uniref:Uncharacterized protein n=1 Tax=Arctium lappa TaxID=4217 RepID=A0ACB9C0P6_ARCLA|nr:hypothetical protein L6452_16428 [Arctium lappa]
MQGSSSECIWRAMEDCQRLHIAEIDSGFHQVEMSPVWQQKKLRDFCSAYHILVIAYAPLGAKWAHLGTNKEHVCSFLLDGVGLVVKCFNKEKKGTSAFLTRSYPTNVKINKTDQHRGMPGCEFVLEIGPYESVEEF